MNAIEARDVRVTYEDGTRAVRGVSLEIPEGEFFGFLGANGAGKTTTIKALVTLLSPTGGSVTVNGYDVESESRMVRRSIGYMAQETSVDPELTARENVRFACEAYGVPAAAVGDRIDDLLDLVDLTDVADKVARDFSGGMKKRLDVATALAHDPPIVFLDEPTTGLDPRARNRLWEYFEDINDRGTTIFLTTQYLEEADRLCDRIAVLRAGEVVAEGSPAELKAEVGGDVLDIELADAGDAGIERAIEVARESGALGTDGTVEPTDDGIAVTSPTARRLGTDLLVALDGAGVTVTGFSVRSPTLDDVFLAVTGEHLGEEDGAGTDGAERERSDGGSVAHDADRVEAGDTSEGGSR